MKLYPPSIEGKLPAFAGTTISFPFNKNRAVNMSSVYGLQLRIKTVKTNRELGSYQGTYNYNEATGSYKAIFDLKTQVENGTLSLIPGEYYKVQIAFLDKNKVNNKFEIGYFSSVGVIKCTTYPQIEIPSLTSNYYGNYEYVGVYKQLGDKTEKVYTYCFELKDVSGNLVATTGTMLHNSSEDKETGESRDSWFLRKNLIIGAPYYITYKVITTNGLECESQGYMIIAQDTVDSSLQEKCDLIATPKFEDGYIKLTLRPKVKHGVVDGSFILARASSEDNFDSWNEIYRFSYKNLNVYGALGESSNLMRVHPDLWDENDILLWEDFTVQQGVQYKYSIQAYNSKGLYSNRLLNKIWELDYLDNDMDTNHNYKEPDGYDEYRKGYYFKSTEVAVTADFEDIFLFDGTRQLKIRYNPKVSSFKSTVLESKIDTLGGKYPFVFRNGNVEYKEFPVAGLLSLTSDPEERFLQGIQTSKLLYRSQATGNEVIGPGDTHVTADNLRRERQFKMEALAWLTNGEPKLFRSPSEGNFIVRIMNVSMTPLDVVGRMLHSFSSTAYEIAECSFENLNEYGFITIPEADYHDFKVGQVKLANPADFEVIDNVILPSFPIYQASFTKVPPGTILGLNFVDGYGSIEVEIGSTGTYYVLAKDKAISRISLIKGADTDILDRSIGGKLPDISEWEDAYLTFCYYDNKPTDNFSYVTDIYVQDEFRQFIGIDHDINIIELLEDIRRETGRFHYIRVTERPIQDIWKINGEWCTNSQGTDIITSWDATVIYWGVNTGKYYDGHPSKAMSSAPGYYFRMNNTEDERISFSGRDIPAGANLDKWWPLHITKTADESLGTPHIAREQGTRGRIDAIHGVDKVTNLHGDTGLIIEIAYRVKFTEYDVEDNDTEVITAKQNWQNAITIWDQISSDSKSTLEEVEHTREIVENAYGIYVASISKALELEDE